MNYLPNSYYFNILDENRNKLQLSSYNTIKRNINTMCESFYDNVVTIDYIINNYELFIDALNKYAQNTKGRGGNETLSDGTKEQYVYSIIMLFNLSDSFKLENAELYEEWSDIYANIRSIRKEKYLSNEPSEKQEKAFVPYEMLQEIKNNLDIYCQERWLLSLYLDIYPVRAGDYAFLRIIYDKLDIEKYKGENLLVIDLISYSAYVHLQKFKTSKTYRVIEQNLPIDLSTNIINKIKNDMYGNGRRFKREYLFVNKYNEKFENKAKYDYWALTTIRKLTKNKYITLTTFRHIYLSYFLNDLQEMDRKSRNEVAKKMGHSLTLQDQYVWKGKEYNN